MSLLNEVLLGVQLPQIVHLPPDVHSHAAATEAIELANAYGVADGWPLDESQEFTLRAGMGLRRDGSWAAATVGDFEPRQNGKNDSCAARELAGLILFGEQLIIHTAHEFPTANESFLRLVSVFENWDDLRSKVDRIRYANGEQGIELLSGQRLKYRARTGGSGRGFAKADLVVYDEAQHLQAEHVAASGPAKLANRNSQSWYMGSGGLSTSLNAWRMRMRALAGMSRRPLRDPGTAGRFAYVEHTAEQVSLDENGAFVSIHPDVLDRVAWALANAPYGIRITDEKLFDLYGELGPALFGRECLCLWDPLPIDTSVKPVKVPADKWLATGTSKRVPVKPGEVTLAFDVEKDGQRSSIGIGAGSLLSPYVEEIDNNAGVGWLPARLVELVNTWDPIAVGCNGAGPAGGQVGPVLAAFSEAGIDANLLHQLNALEYKQACGGFYTDVIEGRLKRPAKGQGPLDVAVADATERPLGDAWAWERRNLTVPIASLVAVTIARALLPTTNDVEADPFML